MALYTNDFEGYADTDPILLAGQPGAAGDAWTAVSKGANSTILASTAHPRRAGGVAGLFTQGAVGETNFLQWGFETGAAAAFRCYLAMGSYPSAANDYFLQLRNTGNVCNIGITSGGKMRKLDSAGANSHNGTVSVPLSWTDVRVEVIATPATSTTGRLQLEWYLGDSLTPEESFDISTWNLGTTAMAFARPGRGTSVTGAWTFQLSDIAWEPGRTTFIGPLAQNLTATINDSIGITDLSTEQVLDVSVPVSDIAGISDTLVVNMVRGGVQMFDFATLRAEGYTGSLSDMRRQKFLFLLGLVEPQVKSLADLEFQYLRGLGYTGSIPDMRSQAGIRPLPY